MILNSIAISHILYIKPSTPSYYIKLGFIAVVAAALAYVLIARLCVRKNKRK